jgi:two-component system OmpR family response regulator
MAKPRILIFTDGTSLRATLARWLLGAGYTVELAESPRRVSEVIADESFNLAIMDARGIGAADSGLAREIAERIKHVILVAQPAKEGVNPAQPDAGLHWPFSERDLLERVRLELESALTAAVPSGPQLLRFEGFTLDADARSLLDTNGQEVTLTRAEFSLLLAFARQPGRVLSRDELTHVVAGRGAEPDDRSVDVLISRLRRKIEPDPKAPRMIVTMPGEGYKFTARPQAVATDPAKIAPAMPAPSLAPTIPAPIEAPKEEHADGSPARPAQAQHIEPGKSSPSTRPLRVVVSAAVIVLIAGLAWLGWSHLPASQGGTEATPQTATRPATQPGVSAERRALAFRRMVEALQDDRFSWRTIERLAIEAGVDEAEAREILGEHLDEVVLGKSREGKLIAKLSAR